MLRDRKIAVFIDVDNCPLQFINYENAFNEISKMGEIVCAKVYGINERKHKSIIEHANNNGYDTLLGMRVKKRGAKVYDDRITADILEAVFTMPNLDAVAVIAAPADMVYLFRMLHKYDVAVIAYDNGDEFTSNLIDEKLDLGVVELLPPPRKTAKKKKIADEANELINKVNEMREQAQEVSAVETQPVEPQHTETQSVYMSTPVEQQPVEETTPVEQQPVEDTRPVEPATHEVAADVAPAQPEVEETVEQEMDNDAEFFKKMQQSLNNYDDEDASVLMEKVKSILKDE